MLAAFHVFLDVRDGRDLVWSFLKFERVFKFALEIAVRRKGKARGGLALRVKSQKLVRQVFHGLAGTRLARVPSSSTEFVERGMRTFQHTVALHQVHAFQGNVKTGIFRIAEQHEFATVPIGFNLP